MTDSLLRVLLIEDNEVYDNTFGIFIRDAANGVVKDNKAHDNCFGVFTCRC